MIKKLFFILFIFSGITLFPQDTLFLKNGDKKVIKLTEVLPNEIKYKRGDNIEGPTYVLDRREIVKVKFANGDEEQLGIATPKLNQSETVKSEAGGNRYLKVQQKDVFFVGEVISDNELHKFIDEYKFPQNKPLMMEHFNRALDYKKKKNLFVSFIPIGFAVPAIATVAGIAMALGPQSDMGGVVFVSGVVVGAALRISGFACSKMFRNKYRAERVKVAILYNESK